MSRLQRHRRLVHMDLFQYLISLLSHRIHCNHCMALICSIHINMQRGFQQTLLHFRYHARAQALPLARPFTDARTFPRRPQCFSPSRSSQTFAFACLTSISNRIISKASDGNFKIKKLRCSENPSPKLGKSTPSTDMLENAPVVGQYALGLPPLSCPVTGKAGTLRHGTVVPGARKII